MAGGSVKLSIYSTFKDDGTKQAERAIDRFTKKYGELDKETGTKKLDDATRALAEQSVQADQAAARWQGYSDKLGVAGAAITKYVSAGAGAAAVASMKLASDFEDSFAKVKTIMDKSAEAPEQMSAEILKLSTDTGKAATELAEATYQAISASVATEDAVDFTGKAVELAKVGFTDTATAVDTLTTTINAYKMSAGDAESISDKLVQTQNRGKTTVDELSSSIGNVIPTAAAYNVSLDNLLTGYVELTKQGINTANSTTALNGMLTELADGGSTVAGVLQEKTGKSFGQLMSDGASLGDVISLLNESVDGDSEAFANLWGNVRASKGALAIANAGAAEFNTELTAMQSSTGNVSAAMEDLVTPSAMANKSINALKNTGIELGEQFLGALAPALQGAAEGAQGLYERFSSLDEGQKQAAAGAVTFAAAAGPVVLGASQVAGGVSTAYSAIGQFTANLAKAESSTTALASKLGMVGSASPAVVAGIVAISAVAVESALLVKEVSQRIDDTNGATKRLVTACTSGAPSVENATASLSGMGEAAGRSSVSIDELSHAQAELADRIAERNGAAQEDINRLEGARQIISRYMNTTIDTAQAQGQFRAAIETVNELCGTQYTVVDAANGKVADERGELMETCDAIDEYIAKKQQQIRADALTENLGELYKQQADDIAAVASKTDELRRAQAELADAEAAGVTGERWQEYADAVQLAQNELGRAQADLDSVNSSIAATEAQLGGAAAAAEGTADSAGKLAQGNSTLFASFRDMPDTFSAFCSALDQAGVSTEQFNSLSQGELIDLATSYHGSVDDIIAYFSKIGEELPDQAEAAVSDTASAIEGGADDAESGAQAVADAAMGPLSDMQGQAAGAGEDASGNFAGGVASGEGSVRGSAALLAATAMVMGDGDHWSLGGDASSNFASGLSSGKGSVSNAAWGLSSAASAMADGNQWQWGNDAAGNFASGLAAGANAVAAAARGIADTVAAILGHSVPKAGPLHNKGLGEIEWGEHAARNFAAGAHRHTGAVQAAFSEVAAAAQAGLSSGAAVAAPAQPSLWPQPVQAQAAAPAEPVIVEKTAVYVDGSLLDVGSRVQDSLEDFVFELGRELGMTE